ncbi:hypothetical protein G9A89_009038 [Geosiphon pyriformis]|nr:hypothetical protein G9A89_009038 [Geosiphon pyriformis]
MATKVQKIMVQPIVSKLDLQVPSERKLFNFRVDREKTRVQIWLYEQGFDEFMNLVLENAEEVNAKKKTRKGLGRILLKGDNITLIQAV